MGGHWGLASRAVLDGLGAAGDDDLLGAVDRLLWHGCGGDADGRVLGGWDGRWSGNSGLGGLHLDLTVPKLVGVGLYGGRGTGSEENSGG